MKQDLLFEIGTEELPAKHLLPLAQALTNSISAGLQKAELPFAEIKTYATPRRLAILVKDLPAKQNARFVERKGPAVKTAFDTNNNPTPALQGFARSCNTNIENLQQIDTQQGAWFIYRFEEAGKDIFELIPEMINKAVTELPIPKPMRWGDQNIAFMRPVHWVVLMYGEKVIPATLLGQTTSNVTYGHRFLAPQAINITTPETYEFVLENAKVIADFHKRKTTIKKQITEIAQQKNAEFDPALLDEVTGLVEWPVSLLATFNKDFLSVPQEALIAAMKDHQKSFSLMEKNQHNLLPHFITISNLLSKDPQEVIRGNERVMRARLSDAKFFYEQDLKSSSEDRLDHLKKIIFQAGLGTIYDKSQRLVKLVNYITQQEDKTIRDNASRAALLCKTDLVSNMVGEFPELQGIMGYYYALHDNKDSSETALAIQQHYWPRFAGDNLPESMTSASVALTDRLDSLIGIFGINQIPTGDKDPFGLRRAAVGIVRILIEKKLPLHLLDVLNAAYQNYNNQLPNKNAVTQVHHYILERLNAWYQEQDVTTDTLAAVLAVQTHNLDDVQKRVLAVEIFRKLPEAASLAAANKRVSNLLTKSAQLASPHSSDILKLVDISLFQNPEEHALYQAIIDKSHQAVSSETYEQQLISLAALKQPVDNFFDHVLVMADDEKLRHNRLALVAALRQLFLAVADISLLQI